MSVVLLVVEVDVSPRSVKSGQQSRGQYGPNGIELARPRLVPPVALR